MIDHVLGRPSTKSRRLQILAVLTFWTFYLSKGNKHGPPGLRYLSKLLTKRLTAWQTIVITMSYLYAARNFSTLVGLSAPEPLANMYEATYFRATWVLTALDAGFWTAMKIRNKWLRNICSIVFTVFYLFQAEAADERVRKVRSNLNIDYLRVSWNKGVTPYLSFLTRLVRPRYTRWPPRQIRIPRPSTSDFQEPVSGWLYFDGPLADLVHHNRIVLDVPGGGFVAMDPRCNDDRLMAWAGKTGIPILSLDYGKAPEYPYPYALNECYDVYTTIINSKGRCIGMSGTEVPKVIISGDSAGGNLATSTTLMIIESGSSPVRRFQGQTDLPLPDAVILFYPGLDMNIGNWMSDEQMTLIKDRRMRGTNRRVVHRKSMQYNHLVGTPHHSSDEDEGVSSDQVQQRSTGQPTIKIDTDVDDDATPTGPDDSRSPHPEFAHEGPSIWGKRQSRPNSEPQSPEVTQRKKQSTSHHSETMRTRLATSSMISYFNDRILTPEMMRAMIILYIGPHNRPDFSTDYLLSPVLAPDVLLAKFPKTYFCTGERDPLVDDTVIFSGRLRRVKAAVYASGGRRFEYQDTDSLAPGFNEKDVAETVLIPGISHGFMQFPSIYPPARKWIDQSARWIEEAFAAAEVRERESRRNSIATPNGGLRITNGEGRGLHSRADSSGDEFDKPLEMTVVRPRGRTASSGNADRRSYHRQQQERHQRPRGNSDGAQSQPQESGTSLSTNTLTPANGTSNGNGGKRRRGNGAKKEYKDGNLSRLASSDDLLGRRMQGLAGGLTGLIEEE
ncbi:hypothetical protein MCOR27_010634 [Pyricularia oryzae]|uniref:Alpha/beta hydrolase fold-3 domain-containing protein n=1 Tax=Pyricularia grisea TaxID=148305 RepID=A0ABQ8NEV4_PYRGI|nr:hypothetical protein MCOR19_000639 [Pyricularia oryzae]KAI6294657.1 hypothetical protein MCOR33_008277 [Pyricularia grisea]KAI6267319.1 hypothetical protein MCOR27_010634 [Pyricularia oryzae]KAI6285005.1 hypothetical protein MCOR26_001703 [Pyricularia oryzae]KAI6312899.1 hypothetical protein MCOR30_010448 [Pyricularia oryzae]